VTSGEPLGLAFFAADRYQIQPGTGALVVPRPGSEPVETQGWEIVSRDELFERWPVWRETYERLQRQLRDTGSA